MTKLNSIYNAATTLELIRNRKNQEALARLQYGDKTWEDMKETIKKEQNEKILFLAKAVGICFGTKARSAPIC